METLRTTCQLTAFLFILFIAGCKPEPIVVDPPDPPTPPVTYPDCSHSFTEPALDTNSIWDIWGWASFTHYEGFEIEDFSFNPNNPNEMVIAMSLYTGISGIGENWDDVLITFNLCTGETTHIHTIPIGDLHSVDWGENGVIIYASGHDLATILPDGGGYHLIPNDPNGNLIVEWLPDSVSFLTRGLFTYGMMRMDTAGNVLDDDVGFPSTPGDMDVMPDGRVAYNSGSIVGIFNMDNGSTESIDDQIDNEMYAHVAYSSLDNAMIWTSDSSLYRTGLTSDIPTVLATGYFNRSYSNVRASKNGHIAYVAHILSYERSQHDDVGIRTELRFINADGTDERRLVLDFE